MFPSSKHVARAWTAQHWGKHHTDPTKNPNESQYKVAPERDIWNDNRSNINSNEEKWRLFLFYFFTTVESGLELACKVSGLS